MVHGQLVGRQMLPVACVLHAPHVSANQAVLATQAVRVTRLARDRVRIPIHRFAHMYTETYHAMYLHTPDHPGAVSAGKHETGRGGGAGMLRQPLAHAATPACAGTGQGQAQRRYASRQLAHPMPPHMHGSMRLRTPAKDAQPAPVQPHQPQQPVGVAEHGSFTCKGAQADTSTHTPWLGSSRALHSPACKRCQAVPATTACRNSALQGCRAARPGMQISLAPRDSPSACASGNQVLVSDDKGNTRAHGP
jgi:hypothetical protein